MLRASLLLAVSLMAMSAVRAEEVSAPPNRTTAAPEAPATKSQRFARDRLMEMARFLGKTDRFSASLRIAYDVVQDDGQKIEFGETRELAVQRPDRIRIVATSSDGDHNSMLFDGRFITISDDAAKVYAQAPQPGDIDATVVHFVRDLQMRLPLAPLLMAKSADELQRRVRSIDYVEHTDILGEPAHHIAARTANVDFQVWIADDKQPLPLRIVMNYPTAEGQPQFRADFSDWDLSPRFGKKAFKFKPADDAKRILFAVQLLPAASSPPSGERANQGAKP